MIGRKWHNTDIDIAVSNRLWSVFDIIKGTISPSEYHLLLFLISIFKDGFFERIFEDRYNAKRNLLDEIHHSFEYEDIVDTYVPLINRLDDRQFYNIADLFNSFSPESIQKNFSSIFDFLLYKISDVLGKKEAGILQPIELTRLVLDIANLEGDEKVYNPFAGLCSFGTFLNDCHYFGQEINATTWAIGKLRLMAYEHYSLFEYRREDSITNWAEHTKFDLILTNPPFGLNMRTMYGFEYSHKRILERFIVEKGLESLSDSGQLISIFPIGFLFKSGNEYKIREQLVNNDLLDMVVAMPGGFLKNTGVQFCIVIINKAKKASGFVRFVDAKSFTTSKNSRSKKLDNDAIYNLINEDRENDFFKYVPNEDITQNKYNLNVPRYFIKEYEGTILSDFCTILKGEKTPKGTIGKLIRIQDLKEDKIENTLILDSIQEDEIPRSARRISKPSLLVARRWKSLKPTYFNYVDNAIYIPNDILAFEIDPRKVNIHYLINELLSDYVSEQVNGLRLGGVMPTILRDDFLSLKVNIIPLEEQNAKVKGLQELSGKLKQLLEENIKVERAKSTEAFNEFASLKHSIGAPRQNILSNAKSLIRFFDRNQSREFTQVRNAFFKTYDIELLDVFKQIREDINHISVILEKGEKGLVLNNYPKKLISLKEISGFVHSLSENGYHFKIQKNLISNTELNQKAIECNITLLRVLFDNILKNAHKYGFKEYSPSNEVVIDLQVIEEIFEVTVKNNGSPFPKKFTKEKFISKYSTANKGEGTGIGGYDIDRIATYFGDSDWTLDLNTSEIYPVIFKFSFTIKTLT